MKSYYLKLAFLVSFIFLISCKEEKKEVEVIKPVGISTYYLIRHAEKDRTDPDNKNPSLNQSGIARALKWGEVFRTVALDEIYSTDYNRTRETAETNAILKNKTVKLYKPFGIDVDSLKKETLNKKILIVGHSNTIPKLVNELIGEKKYDQIEDNVNSNLYIVNIVNGEATSLLLNIDHCIPRDFEEEE